MSVQHQTKEKVQTVRFCCTVGI